MSLRDALAHQLPVAALVMSLATREAVLLVHLLPNKVTIITLSSNSIIIIIDTREDQVVHPQLTPCFVC